MQTHCVGTPLTCTNQFMSSWWLQMPWCWIGSQVIINSHADSSMTTMSHEYVAQQKCSRDVRRSEPGPWFNIKMSSYQYRKSHCGDKTVVRSSYLHNGISYTGKMSSLYWIGALFVSLLLPSYFLRVIKLYAGITRPDRVNLYGFHL